MSDKDCINGDEVMEPADLDRDDELEQPYNGPDRRRRGRRASDFDELAAIDRRSGWDRRRGPGRRRSDERRTAEEGEMNDEQFAFIMAIDEYKRVNKRPFPSYTEILEIAKALGYRKVAEPTDLNAISKS